MNGRVALAAGVMLAAFALGACATDESDRAKYAVRCTKAGIPSGTIEHGQCVAAYERAAIAGNSGPVYCQRAGAGVACY